MAYMWFGAAYKWYVAAHKLFRAAYIALLVIKSFSENWYFGVNNTNNRLTTLTFSPTIAIFRRRYPFQIRDKSFSYKYNKTVFTQSTTKFNKSF